MAPLWSAFGAAAGAAAGAGSIWGTIGTAIYNGANWVGGTLSSMTSGISKGISTVIDGGFKGLANGSLGTAGEQVMSGLTKAFTGQAGTQAVATGVANSAALNAAADVAGQSVWKQATSQIYDDVVGNSINIHDTEMNKAIDKNLQPYDPTKPEFLQTPQASQAPSAIEQQIASGKTTADAATVARANVNNSALTQSSGGTYGTSGAGTSLLSKASKVAKGLATGFDGEAYQSAYQPVGDVGGQKFKTGINGQGGIGSGGGQFLSQSMLQMMQETQQRMARGF
jgi:hypothetical protein